MTEEQLERLSDEELELEVNRIKDEENNPQDETPQEEEEENIEEDTVQEEEEETQETLQEENEEEFEETSGEDTENTEDKYRIRADGLDYDFTVEELKQLAPKAMNYTKKMQAIAPYGRMISAIEENKLSQEDINTLIDIKKGNKDALATLAKGSNIDIYDIDSEEDIEYQPQEYGKDEEYRQLQEVVTSISKDEHFSKTQSVLDSIMDDESKAIMYANPAMVNGLHIDVGNGDYERVMPQAQKMAVMDNFKKPLLEYYLEAGNKFHEDTKIKKKETLKAKKASSLPKQRSRGKKVTDYLSEEEEDKEYQKWYNKIQQNY